MLLNSTYDYIELVAQEGEKDIQMFTDQVEKNFNEINSQLDQIIESYREDNSAVVYQELPIAFESVINKEKTDSGFQRFARSFKRQPKKVIPKAIEHDGFISDDINSKFVFVPISPDENSPTGIHFKAQKNLTCCVEGIKTKFYFDDKLMYKKDFKVDGKEELKYDFNESFHFDKMIVKANKNQVHGNFICLPSFSLYITRNYTESV